MCHHMMTPSFAQVSAAMNARSTTGRATVPPDSAGSLAPLELFPGGQAPILVPTPDGSLTPVTMTWGFETQHGGRKRLVFNTRLETALEHARSGRGMWANTIVGGRCLVPVGSFFESDDHRTVKDPKTGRARRLEHRFTLSGHRIFLLAAVAENGRFSVVTTAPNRSVAGIHNRMSLVLGPGESSVWLGPDFASLADRSGIALNVEAETEADVESGCGTETDSGSASA